MGVVFVLAPFDPSSPAPGCSAWATAVWGWRSGPVSATLASRLPADRQGLAFAVFSALAKITLALGVLIVAVAIHPDATAERLRGFMAAGPILTSIGMIILARRATRRPDRSAAVVHA